MVGTGNGSAFDFVRVACVRAKGRNCGGNINMGRLRNRPANIKRLKLSQDVEVALDEVRKPVQELRTFPTRHAAPRPAQRTMRRLNGEVDVLRPSKSYLSEHCSVAGAIASNVPWSVACTQAPSIKRRFS